LTSYEINFTTCKLYFRDQSPLDFYDHKPNYWRNENYKQERQQGPSKTPYKGLSLHDTGTINTIGSLYKYQNDGHNYNDLILRAVLFVLSDLNTKLISQTNAFWSVEIGINITPPIPTNEILIIVYSQNKTFWISKKFRWRQNINRCSTLNTL
jgi:hypothetical protein